MTKTSIGLTAGAVALVALLLIGSQYGGFSRLVEAATLSPAEWATRLQGALDQSGPGVRGLNDGGSWRWHLPPFWLICLLAGLGFLIAALRSTRDNAAPGNSAPRTAPSELAMALRKCRGAVLGTVAFSGILNVLMLTGSLYMLEVYDRVIPSRSVPTLIGLSIITAALFIGQGLLEVIRSRLLVRIGLSLDEGLSARVFETIGRLALKQGATGEGTQPVRDLDTIRSFLAGLGPTALFDLPWIPIYLAVLFAFHPTLGLTGSAGAVILVALALLTEIYTRGPIKAATVHATARHHASELNLRNAEVIAAMGMSGAMTQRWLTVSRDFLDSQKRASDVAGGLGTAAKIGRIMLQSAMLGMGAYLVIKGELSAGVIIAASILSSRALAPVDLAIANWKGFVAARQSWQRLNALLATLAVRATPMALPAPTSELRVERVSAAAPGDDRAIIQDVSFVLSRGQGLGIIGPSGSGKSSLVRLLVGAWNPARGKVRLDGAALDQWPPDTLGRHVGYLPQAVELFAGTIAQNISRFSSDADPAAIVEAARAAGVHELILEFPKGYGTEIGTLGSGLSAGQAQRIALARALYGNPFLIVLDEPNSNLDAEGEAALTQAIVGARERGAIAVVVAHRPSALAAVDHLMIVQRGRVQAFGPRDEVMATHLRAAPASASALKVVPESRRQA